MAARNRFPMPTGDMPPNPWKYDYWSHMHESIYYKSDPVDDVYCFKIDGQDVRLRVGYYEQDPRWMRISFDNRKGNEVFELTQYVRGAYGECDMVTPSAYIPRYTGLCHDQCEGAPAGLFEQLQDRHLCVPIYGDTGRISARGNQWDLLLPEYVFDEDALISYDPEGMQKYDAQLAACDAAMVQWPGSERTFARAVMNHYNLDTNVMIGWPSSGEYTGPGAQFEKPDVSVNAYVDDSVFDEIMQQSENVNMPRLSVRTALFFENPPEQKPLSEDRELVGGGSAEVMNDLRKIFNQFPFDGQDEGHDGF